MYNRSLSQGSHIPQVQKHVRHMSSEAVSNFEISLLLGFHVKDRIG